jgi:arsenite methyltransferase
MSGLGVISLEQDTVELARAYEQAGILQFHHGKFLIGPLALKSADRVLDIGAGTGRLTEFVAGLVGPQGRVVGIDPLENRITIARLRQSEILTFDVGRAEDLSRFDAGEFDVVYLNSVFHWIDEKRRTLEEIHRVLRPGGRLGLNIQDPSKPHESRVLLRRAIEQAGFADYRSDLRSLVDLHNDVDSVLKWSEASAFGNFLDRFSQSERDRIRVAFADLLEAKRIPEGLRLERYLRFAFARKPEAPNTGS